MCLLSTGSPVSCHDVHCLEGTMERGTRVYRRRGKCHLSGVPVAVGHVGTHRVIVSDEVLSARRVGTASGSCHLLALHDAMQLLFADANWPTAPIEWCEYSHRLERCLRDQCGVPTWLLPDGSGLLLPRVRQLVFRIHALLLCCSSD